jgi:sugar lactone lactonase YvrE
MAAVAMTAPLAPAFAHRCLLGESPVWSPGEQCVYWVDIHRPSILRGDPARRSTREWPMPTNVGSIGLARRGLVVALRSGFASFDPATSDLAPLDAPLAGVEHVRFNDGRVDRRGRFWSATVSERRVAGEAALYRLDGDGSSRRMLDGLTVGNGIAWSPDDRTMYLADSWERTIYAFDFDIDDGAISNRRTFARFAADEGIPDGATVDADGAYWSAHFDGGRITRFTPDGRRDRTFLTGMPRPTSCEFIGTDLRTLLVTSASFGLTDAQRAASPESGKTFTMEGCGQGLPEPVFAGSPPSPGGPA